MILEQRTIRLNFLHTKLKLPWERYHNSTCINQRGNVPIASTQYTLQLATRMKLGMSGNIPVRASLCCLCMSSLHIKGMGNIYLFNNYTLRLKGIFWMSTCSIYKHRDMLESRAYSPKAVPIWICCMKAPVLGLSMKNWIKQSYIRSTLCHGTRWAEFITMIFPSFLGNYPKGNSCMALNSSHVLL